MSKTVYIHHSITSHGSYVIVEVMKGSSYVTNSDSWLWLTRAYRIKWASPKLILLVALLVRQKNIRQLLGCGGLEKN